MLSIIGYFFSLFYMPMHDLLKKKEKYAKKNKKQKDQNTFKYDCKHVF